MGFRKGAILLLFFVCVLDLNSRTIYVDLTLSSSNCLGKYSVVNRNCSGSDGDAFKKLSDALAVVVRGDIVILRSGIYTESLIPSSSGLKERRIVIKGMENEKIVFTGSHLSPAIYIESKSYISIENIEIINVNRWANILVCKGIEFKNCSFRNANDPGGSSKTGLFFQDSDYNTILNCRIDSSTQDNIALIQSSHNLIQGNINIRAVHALWAIKCGSFNVIRRNYFANNLQKIGEIYDCDDVGFGSASFPKLSKKNSTKCNLVEENIFALTSTPINASPYAGIQLSAQSSIIRRNLFYDCIGPPIDLTLYDGEAENNYDNKIYHNLMYNNHFGGITIPAAEGKYLCFGNEVFNNIFYNNNFVQYDKRWNWYGELHEKPVQIMFLGSSTRLKTYTSRIFNNGIYHSSLNKNYFIVYGDRFSSTNPSFQELSWWETNYSEYIEENLTVDPLLMDVSQLDFRVSNKSPMIDRGAFMTSIQKIINDTILQVADAGYFYDGFGIEGLQADTIQSKDSRKSAIIKSVDYGQKLLYLDRAHSWVIGELISLKYNGVAPDIGIFETSQASNVVTKKNREEIQIYYDFYSEQLHIKSESKEPLFIQIYSLDGRLILKDQIPYGEENIRININSIQPGLYFLRINNKSNPVFKFMKI